MTVDECSHVHTGKARLAHTLTLRTPQYSAEARFWPAVIWLQLRRSRSLSLNSCAPASRNEWWWLLSRSQHSKLKSLIWSDSNLQTQKCSISWQSSLVGLCGTHALILVYQSHNRVYWCQKHQHQCARPQVAWHEGLARDTFSGIALKVMNTRKQAIVGTKCLLPFTALGIVLTRFWDTVLQSSEFSRLERSTALACKTHLTCSQQLTKYMLPCM